MRSAKRARDCSESLISQKSIKKLRAAEQPKKVRTVDAARALVDLMRFSYYVGLQPNAAKCIGTAAREHNAATLLVCEIAAGGC